MFRRMRDLPANEGIRNAIQVPQDELCIRLLSRLTGVAHQGERKNIYCQRAFHRDDNVYIVRTRPIPPPVNTEEAPVDDVAPVVHVAAVLEAPPVLEPLPAVVTEVLAQPVVTTVEEETQTEDAATETSATNDGEDDESTTDEAAPLPIASTPKENSDSKFCCRRRK